MKSAFMESFRDKLRTEIADASEANCFVGYDDREVPTWMSKLGFLVFHTGTSNNGGEDPAGRPFSVGVTVFYKFPANDPKISEEAVLDILGYVQEIKDALRNYAFGQTDNYANLVWTSQTAISKRKAGKDNYVLGARTIFTGTYFEL